MSSSKLGTTGKRVGVAIATRYGVCTNITSGRCTIREYIYVFLGRIPQQSQYNTRTTLPSYWGQSPNPENLRAGTLVQMSMDLDSVINADWRWLGTTVHWAVPVVLGLSGVDMMVVCFLFFHFLLCHVKRLDKIKILWKNLLWCLHYIFNIKYFHLMLTLCLNYNVKQLMFQLWLTDSI